MEDTRYKNGKKLYIIACIFTGLCMVGFILYHALGLHIAGEGPKCFMNAYWHIYCPGCGGTRAFDYLMHGNFIKSIMAHPVDIYLAILYFSYFFRATYTFLIKKDGKLYYEFHPWTLILLLVIIVVFFIIRNIILVYFNYDFLGDCIVYWNN